ncbi:AAA family ATPase [Paractinoplanes atraurantiacus]|uniref:AAA family ATPase n=1 Tax=Paractinoplanes atraurantiacus TaxID=1036182 RepID=UPI003F693B91
MGAAVLSSDRIRKEIAGLTPERSAAAGWREGIYTAEWTDRTYHELLDRARRLLERGESVVLDASWYAPRRCEAARDLAQHARGALHEIRCTATTATVAERLARRHSGVSDADAVIASAMSASFAPWPEAVEIATEEDPDKSLARACTTVET